VTGREWLADLLMVVHAGYSIFVVIGLFLVLTGTLLGWRWVRVGWFPIAHLVAILFVVARVWIGLPCPFSAAEDSLRRSNSSALSAPADCPLGSGFHDLFHRFAFRGKDPHRFARSTTVVGALVLGVFLFNRSRHRPYLSRTVAGDAVTEHSLRRG